MNYDMLVAVMIQKTRDNTFQWKLIHNLPECIVLKQKSIKKIFISDNILPDARIYLIEYTFEEYSEDEDRYITKFCIRCSIVKDDIEAAFFDYYDLTNPEKLYNLKDVIVKKIYPISNDINALIQKYSNERI